MSPVRIASRIRPSAKYRTRALVSTATLAIAVAFLHPVPAKAQFNGIGDATTVRRHRHGRGHRYDQHRQLDRDDRLDREFAMTFLPSDDDPEFHQRAPSRLHRPQHASSRSKVAARSSSTASSIRTSTAAHRRSAATSGSTAQAESSSDRPPLFDVGGLLLTSLNPTSQPTAATGFDATFRADSRSATAATSSSRTTPRSPPRAPIPMSSRWRRGSSSMATSRSMGRSLWSPPKARRSPPTRACSTSRSRPAPRSQRRRPHRQHHLQRRRHDQPAAHLHRRRLQESISRECCSAGRSAFEASAGVARQWRDHPVGRRQRRRDMATATRVFTAAGNANSSIVIGSDRSSDSP